ncbi:VOC family protein [Alteromonas sp. ASW11-36]|uniref:VOC family protein n=1 Tax=Alteromonas arenosi TaxID=3055817 RepID=A0ABT7T270_9ALTE|nr:VOC family protein [Alteromonas sp. ASW11-36]MDM7861887.1 VOC family protein [Alteromonas sp. ASW11-36]
MHNNPVGWFEIYVQDIERAKSFYEQVLCVQLTALPIEGIAMLAFPSDDEGAGASGALVHAPSIPSGGNSTVVYFSCEDCAVEEGRVEAAGGTVSRSKMSIGDYGFCSMVLDPDGNLFGLHSMQ